jgi:hypothetical protein
VKKKKNPAVRANILLSSLSNRSASQFRVREGKFGWNESLRQMWFCFRGVGGLNFMAVKLRVGRLAPGLYSLPTDTMQPSVYMVDIPGVSY